MTLNAVMKEISALDIKAQKNIRTEVKYLHKKVRTTTQFRSISLISEI